MKNKVTKSFALDEVAIEAINEIKDYLELKNDSEVITYAIYHLAYSKNNHDLKKRLEQEIARRRYSYLVMRDYNASKKLK